MNGTSPARYLARQFVLEMIEFVSTYEETMGKLLGIAWKVESRAPMAEATAATVSGDTGVERDHRGQRDERQVTVVAREDWQKACDQLGTVVPWTVRRANLLIEGVALAESTGTRLRIADLVLEVTGECGPCTRMDEQHEGLTAALQPEWRGGVTCRVVSGGRIAVGDAVAEIRGEK